VASVNKQGNKIMAFFYRFEFVDWSHVLVDDRQR
jgi:hypothetical protein